MQRERMGTFFILHKSLVKSTVLQITSVTMALVLIIEELSVSQSQATIVSIGIPSILIPMT